MTYYLRSNSMKAYTFGNKTIPAFAKAGKVQGYLQLDQNEFNELKNIKIMASLMKNGEIAVYDSAPDNILVDAHVARGDIAALKTKVAELSNENDRLKKEAANAKTSMKGAGNWEKKYHELESEAKESIAALQEQIAGYQAQLDEANAKLAEFKKK